MSLFICRHGRTQANAAGLLLGRADPALDQLGQAQAAAMASYLPRPTLVLTSPMERCRQTANLIATSIPGDVQPVVDDRLVELDYGELDLTPLSEVPAELWAAWQADSDFRPAGGETLNELATRVSYALDDVAEEAAESHVVVVSHVSPIKAAVAWALGVSIDISWRCFVDQASVTEIGIRAGAEQGDYATSLRRFNDVAHLRGLDG